MKTILAVYLIFFRGYSVMRTADYCDKWTKEDGWGACDSPMEFDYSGCEVVAAILRAN